MHVCVFFSKCYRQREMCGEDQPGVDAVLPVKRGFDGQTPVVQFQCRKVTLVQTHHFSMGQSGTVRAVT